MELKGWSYDGRREGGATGRWGKITSVREAAQLQIPCVYSWQLAYRCAVVAGSLRNEYIRFFKTWFSCSPELSSACLAVSRSLLPLVICQSQVRVLFDIDTRGALFGVLEAIMQSSTCMSPMPSTYIRCLTSPSTAALCTSRHRHTIVPSGVHHVSSLS